MNEKKSLLTDELEVKMDCWDGRPRTLYWQVENSCDFGIEELEQNGGSKTIEACKINFIQCAVRNGWKKWRFL